jgi:TPR repeat protein
MNDLVPKNGGNSLETHKTSSSLVARGLSSLIDATQKDLDFEMGHNYWLGLNGYEQSEELALDYFKKSAAKNNFEAMCDLALLLSLHLACGCLRDDSHTCGMNESAQLDVWESRTKESVGWLHKAALANHPRAQYELPGWVCYCDGETECGEISCELDKSGWLEKAAAQNYPPAHLKLGIEKHPENAAYYFEQLENSDPQHPKLAYTIFELACHYINGTTFPLKKDVGKGIVLLKKAANLDCYSAQIYLAKLLSENKICAPDSVQAFFWCCKANESGNGSAYFLMASFYEQGVGTSINYAKSIECLQKLIDEHPRYLRTELAIEKISQLKQKLTNTNL